MTNDNFWKKLDRFTKRPQTVSSTRDLINVLIDGYEQNNDVILYGFERFRNGEELVSPLCVSIESKADVKDNDDDEMTAFLLFTRHENLRNVRDLDALQKSVPVLCVERPKLVEVSIINLLEEIVFSDNEASDVQYLIFNLDSPNMYIVDISLMAGIFMSRGFFGR